MVTPTETWVEFNKVISLVNAQAEDDGIWFIAETASEAYLQERLRELHTQVEKMHSSLESEYSVKQ